MNIKKGDTVTILKGKDKGKSGKIVRVYVKEEKVMIEGLNLYKKHVRPRRQGEKGEVVQVSRPLPASNAALECPNCKRGVRTGYRFEADKKVRYCKKCNAVI